MWFIWLPHINNVTTVVSLCPFFTLLITVSHYSYIFYITHRSISMLLCIVSHTWIHICSSIIYTIRYIYFPSSVLLEIFPFNFWLDKQIFPWYFSWIPYSLNFCLLKFFLQPWIFNYSLDGYKIFLHTFFSLFYWKCWSFSWFVDFI